MAKASQKVLAEANLTVDDMGLVPLQANLRIIEAVGKKLGAPEQKLFVNIERYGNMSAATAFVALVEAVEEGYVKPGANILVPAFGAGLTWSSHLISWGERVKPLGTNDVDLPPCDKSALELVQSYLAQQQPHQGITD
jgi:3-oxoacyl-[acyl-carrier-protein] synthase-3